MAKWEACPQATKQPKPLNDIAPSHFAVSKQPQAIAELFAPRWKSKTQLACKVEYALRSQYCAAVLKRASLAEKHGFKRERAWDSLANSVWHAYLPHDIDVLRRENTTPKNGKIGVIKGSRIAKNDSEQSYIVMFYCLHPTLRVAKDAKAMVEWEFSSQAHKAAEVIERAKKRGAE
ncbi:hypothetical protein FIBSPDRAFT_891251 [Athelia psychrophila]|uniref:Uncharacterized protein n=1 Tax=Athelia psychrophila TaxID=1759441 RepID=A0A166JXW6_9AGAM|nr:hypothetical protein FIBSPDRAFT_891251 [Fibularhizoctonia sp. CBS 109695]